MIIYDRFLLLFQKALPNLEQDQIVLLDKRVQLQLKFLRYQGREDACDLCY